MERSTITMPHLRDTLRDTLDNYPNGFILDYEALIREFWRPNHPEVLATPGEVYEVIYPGYGVITFQGRNYTFVPTAEYAAKKGYPPKIEGSWG